MSDRVSAKQRSENMRQIKGRDTAPEMFVRRMVHAMGFRYRLHSKELPGKPDLVFPALRKVIFVHGCFWHQHQFCQAGRMPSSNSGYWSPKLLRNVERDILVRQALEARGWEIAVVWECETKDEISLRSVLKRFLDSKNTDCRTTRR